MIRRSGHWAVAVLMCLLSVGCALLPTAASAAGAASAVGTANVAGPAAGAGRAADAGSAASGVAVTGLRTAEQQYSNAGTLEFTVSSITPQVVTASSGNVLTVRGSVRNVSGADVTGLRVRLQRGPALRNAAAVRQSLVEPATDPTAAVGPFRPFAAGPAGGAAAGAAGTDQQVGGTVRVGERAEFVVAEWIGGSSGLQITTPGVYPVLVNVNGTTEIDGRQRPLRLGELHLLLTVTAVPGQNDGKGLQAKGSVPVGVLWQLSSRPHRGVQGCFLDDRLATEISAGGRLDARLRAIESSALPAAMVPVVDPMLLDDLAAMAGGYRVLKGGADGRPAVQPPLTQPPQPRPTGPPTQPVASATAGTPTATGTGGPGGDTAGSLRLPEPATVPGSGASTAADFLQRISALTREHRLIVLPTSDPDVQSARDGGVTDAGAQLAALTASGRQTAAHRLGPGSAVVTDVAVPPGPVDGATLGEYLSAGQTGAVLPRSSVAAGSKTGSSNRVRVDLGGGRSLPALLPDAELSPLLDRVLAPGPGARRRPGAAPQTEFAGSNVVPTPGSALNTTVALLAARAVDGAGEPVVQLPSSPVDTAGLAELGEALAALDDAGLVTGADAAELLRQTPTTAPRVNAVDEVNGEGLNPEYLRHYSDTRAELAEVASALAVPNRPAGTALIRTLTAATVPLLSASLRADTAPGDAVLATLDGTTAFLRQGVQLRLTQGSYTLASKDAPLRLDVTNSLPYPVLMNVAVSAPPNQGLTAVSPEQPTLIEPGQTATMQLQTTVQKAGRLQAQAQLVAPSGAPWGAPSVLNIRSDAYGALTVVLIAVAGGVLLLMVVLRLWQRWRQRGTGDGDAAADGDSTAAAGDEGRTGPGGESGAAAGGAAAASSGAGSDRGAPRAVPVEVGRPGDTDTADGPGNERGREDTGDTNARANTDTGTSRGHGVPAAHHAGGATDPGTARGDAESAGPDGKE